MAKVVTEKLTLKFKRRKMKDREIERRESWGCMDVIVVGRKRGFGLSWMVGATGLL